MRIKRISIQRFRLFEKSQTVEFLNADSPLVLVGPNNNGKTSFCEAIQMLLGVSQNRSTFTRRRLQTQRSIRYNYLRDYPISIKKNKGRVWPTSFIADIDLTQDEKKQIETQYGITLKLAKIKIIKEWDNTNKQFKFSTKGSNANKDQDQKIAIEILGQFKTIYVPAIRNPEELNTIFDELFTSVVEERINNSIKIKESQRTLTKLITPEITKTTKSINQILNRFLGNNAKLNLEWGIQLKRAVELNDVRIDDGNDTSMSLKGDGIKSLSLIALLTQLSQLKSENEKKNLILIIEEPEAHLNSSYLYPLKEAIKEFAANSTVVLTTHSPVFVDFYNESNYLIVNGEIRKPKLKSEIANCLGIQLNENLVSNNLCLIVEGDEDKSFIEKIFTRDEYKKIKSKFDIIPAIGVDNVTSTFHTLSNLYKQVFILIDNDKQANDHLIKIQKSNVPIGNIFKVPVLDGYGESEIEDTISLEALAVILSNLFNRDITAKALAVTKKKYKGKWSSWMNRFLNEIGSSVKDASSLKKIIWADKDRIVFDQHYSTFIEQIRSTILKNS